jgi:hypothetical protein
MGAFALRWISGHSAFEALRHWICPLPELFLEGLERQRENFIERSGIESGVSIIIPTFVGIHSTTALFRSTTALFRSTTAPVLEFFEHREKSIERPALKAGSRYFPTVVVTLDHRVVSLDQRVVSLDHRTIQG